VCAVTVVMMIIEDPDGLIDLEVPVTIRLA
jgi:hypothetical protein